MGYRENILANIRTQLTHPLHRGVKMQAHHLLSKKGVRDSGLKSKLEHLGYDINDKNNLVLLPCTLKGACHLAVQLHRGNHTALARVDLHNDDDDDDGIHGISYHVFVRQTLNRIKRKLDEGDLCEMRSGRVQRLLDRKSRTVLSMIANFVLPLTSIHESFEPDAASGCCGCDATGDAGRQLAADSDVACPSARRHAGDEGITHPGGPYTLRVGH